MIVVLSVVGLLIAIGEFFSARSNRSTFTQAQASAVWLRVYRWRWVIGVLFAIASAFIYYPMTGGEERYRVMGFPFMVAAFDSAGRDYVGPLTTPSFLANAAIWFFLPHVAFFLWRFAGGTKPQTPNQALQPTAGRSDV